MDLTSMGCGCSGLPDSVRLAGGRRRLIVSESTDGARKMLKVLRLLGQGHSPFGGVYEVGAGEEGGFVACALRVGWVREMGGRGCGEVPVRLPAIFGVVDGLEAAGGMAEEVSIWEAGDQRLARPEMRWQKENAPKSSRPSSYGPAMAGQRVCWPAGDCVAAR